MTRILSYNILAGGYNMRENNSRRTEQLIKVIRSAQPDVVGLPEAIHPALRQKPIVIEEVAEALGMQLIPGGEPGSCTDYQLALLTRLPVVYSRTYRHPALARPLLEVCVEQEDGEQLIVFVTHLSAAFNRGRAGGHIRYREVQEIMRLMEPVYAQRKPHLLMGDFNSLAPGESFKASSLLKYVLQMDIKREHGMKNDGHPHLNQVVPPKLRFLNPVLQMVARNDLLCSLFDAAAYYYAPRGCIELLQRRYEDCFRLLHPLDSGFTCPAGAPAGRIDYIFANDALAQRLTHCSIVHGTEGVQGYEASDHLPVLAEFGNTVPLHATPASLSQISISSKS